MGVVNVTPDSFAGDGHVDPVSAIAEGLAMVDAGADILDVGGESTRPGAIPVEGETERRRIQPVIEALVRLGRYLQGRRRARGPQFRSFAGQRHQWTKV